MGYKAEKLKFGIRPLPPDTKFKDTYLLLATWFGCGRLRPGSGTWGSIGAIPLGLVIMYLGGPIALGLAALFMLWLGTLAADWYGKRSGVVDDQAIVVDEVVGIWIAAIPAEMHLDLWFYALVAFRIFDIFKPWPASFYDNRSKSGFDVMMDDVVAGFYALILVAAAALRYKII